MNKKIDIQNKVEAAMNSLDGISSASPGPFFFTRLQARLYKAEKNVWEKMSAYIARPTVAIAVISFVVLINTIAIIQHKNSAQFANDPTEQSVYDEFNLAAKTFYDYEIKEP